MRTEEQTEHHGRNVRRSRADRPVVFLSGLFCLAAVCAAVYTVSYISGHREQAATAQSFSLVTEASMKARTINDPAERQAELDEIVREGLITFSINTTPNLKMGDSEANLLIENPPDSGTCLTVSVSRDDTGEETYKFDYLDLKQYIDNTPLNVTLPKGEYPCMAYFDSYRIKDSSYLEKAATKITVYILD